MDFQVEDKGQVLKRVNVTVPGDIVGSEESKAMARIRKRAKLKGFRKGKVPNSVLKKMYGQQVRVDATTNLVQARLQELITELPDMIHMSPWRLVDARTDDGGFTFEVDVEVKPTLDVSGYLGLEVEQPRIDVADEDLEKGLEYIQEQHTETKEVDGRDVVEDGDIAVIDYAAVGAGPIAEMANSGQEVEVGSGQAIPGLEEGLIGLKLGEESEIKVTLPDPFPPVPALAGDEIGMKVTVTSIKAKVVPELDDELAKKTGDAETMDELKEKLRADIEKQRREQAQGASRANLLEKLREANTFELPNGYIQQRTERRLNEQREYFTRQGLQPNDVDQILGGSIDMVRETVGKEVQNEMILDAIAAREEIVVEQSDLDARMQELAEQTRLPLMQIQRLYGQAHLREGLEDDIKRQKTLDHLLESATIVEVDPEAAEVAEPEAVEAESSDDGTTDDAAADE